MLDRSPRATRWRAWSRSLRPWSTRWSCSSTCCPPARHVAGLRPGAGPRPAHDLVATSPGVPAGVLGGGGRRRAGADRPRRRGAFRTARRRAHACTRARTAWWTSRRSASPDAAVAAPVVGPRPARSSRSTPTSPSSVEPDAAGAVGRRLPRRHRGGGRRHRDAAARRLAGRAGHRGPRPGPAAGRGAAPAATSRSGWSTRSPTRPTPAWSTVTCGRPRHGFVADALRLAVLTGDDLVRRSGRRHQGQRRMPRAGATTDRPAGAAAPATTSCTSSTASAGTSRWSQRTVGRRRPANTWSSSTRRPSAASPATGCTCRPTSSTRSPATSAASSPTLDRMGGADWAKRKGRARKAVRQIAARADQAVRRPAGHRRATRSPRTRPGSASSRTRSPTSRRPTSSPPSRRSSATWSRPSRWTG